MAGEQTIRDDQGRPIIEITVAEAIKGETLQGKIRLSEILLQEIGIQSGDIVEIFGTKSTSGVAGTLTIGETNELIVRMDSVIRQNAGVELGEPVRIKRAIPRMATLLSLETSDNIASIRPGINQFLKTKLQGIPITIGDFMS